MNNEPKGYKRETLLLEKDQIFGLRYNEENEQDETVIIVDTLESPWHRRVATDSRKYAPIFYKEYFDIYDLDASDYEFYFNRPIGSSEDIFFASGRITGNEIFAENGFVYNIDRIVEPLQNAYQILSDPSNNPSYTDFLDLINLFPEFRYNEEKTFDQPGADLGLEVDSLFDLTYPELTFDINNEMTQAPSGTFGLPANVTIRYHHGMVAPTNEAFSAFINEYLEGPKSWGSLEDAPRNIKRIIANTHMCINPIYPTDFNKGFNNGEMDIVTLNQADIIRKEYGSNSTFIGVNKVIVPRAFKAVTGPIYLQRGYSKVMFAIEQSGLLPALKRVNENYMLFVESDANTREDSSLLYYPFNERFSVYQITEGSKREYYLGINDLRTLLLNHIGTETPRGIARKEFIKNLAGNYLTINKETGEVSGTAPTTYGYKGITKVTVIPTQISTDADNGITYDIENWFNFSASNLFNKISGSYPEFHKLLQKAGLSSDLEYRYRFISENEFYTVFAPNDSTVIASGADTLDIEDLKQFLLMHFIQGDLIFTDGNKLPAYYETARIDEKSTSFSKVFTKIYINPGYDMISIPNKTGGTYLIINESELTNVLTGRNLGDGTEVFANVVNNAVVHEIDRVLLFEDLDTR